MADERPATRAAAGSGRWQQKQTRPGRLLVPAVEADQASGCAPDVRTASRSSCAHAVTSQGISNRPGNVSRVFMDVARDLARRFFWTALRFKRAYIAVELACSIQQRLAFMHGAACPKPLTTRVVIDVAGRIADAMQRAQRRPSLYSSVPLPRTGPELAQRTASWAER